MTGRAPRPRGNASRRPLASLAGPWHTRGLVELPSLRPVTGTLGAGAGRSRRRRRVGGIAILVDGLVRLLALVLALQLTPALEVMENGVHVLAEGHAAHALDDAEHAPSGDCHGCSPTFHVCSCHAPVGVVLRADRLELVIQAPPRMGGVAQEEASALPAHARGVFRPPIG